jgi:hypothetical protein
MSTFSQFFPAAGGGGLTPKFQDFTSSGTFTPTQALIDAGGYIEVFIVGGGGRTTSSSNPPVGGEVIIQSMYLTSTSSVSVTVGAGATSTTGGNSVFSGASAGGSNVTAKGGNATSGQVNHLSASWGAKDDNTAGNGVFGYGAGGAGIQGDGGVYTPLTNSGQAGAYYVNGASGIVKLKWFE